MESNQLFVIDESGNEIEMEVLFTFENEESKTKYVLYFDPNDESGEVFASIYDEEGNLTPVVNAEEWAMIEEVFGAFVSDENQDEEELQEDGQEEVEEKHEEVIH